ncbi:MAG: VTT domain-containing protein [Candidatus Aenigmarchaeota archaeon]|nr:VTT domain-containing protein [Candidatus Aenigmarchaeota archaeon]
MAFFEVGIIELIQWAGYVGLFGIIFAESGIFVGFFLPGDSLLFTAGLLASRGLLDIWILLPLLAAAAITGDSVGYWTGKRFGRKLFERPNSRLFKKERLARAEAFYQKHGGKTIILARFIPVVRTFAPIAAGVALMRYRSFLAYNVVGALIWAVGITLAGFLLGSVIPDVEAYLLPIIGIIVLTSFIPAGVHMLKRRLDRQKPEKI